MVNHILHPLGDRTLCEPGFMDLSAPSVSVDPAHASCPLCVSSYDTTLSYRRSHGITEERFEEIKSRAEKALKKDEVSPDDAISLTPGEIFDLLEEANLTHGVRRSEEAPSGADPSKMALSEPEAPQVHSSWAPLLHLLLDGRSATGRPVIVELLETDPDLRRKFAKTFTLES